MMGIGETRKINCKGCRVARAICGDKDGHAATLVGTTPSGRLLKVRVGCDEDDGRVCELARWTTFEVLTTPIEPSAPAQDWSLEALRAVKTAEEAKRWVGARVRICNECEVKLGGVSSGWPDNSARGWTVNGLRTVYQLFTGYLYDIVAVLSPPPAQHTDSKEQGCPNDTDGDGNCGQPACPVCGKQKPAPAVETFPGGFKVGDRVKAKKTVIEWGRGTVCPIWEFYDNRPDRTRGSLRWAVTVRLDGPAVGLGRYVAAGAEHWEHLKEEEPKAASSAIDKVHCYDHALSAEEVVKVVKDRSGNGLDAKVEPAKPKDDDGRECIDHDSRCHGAQDDIVQVLCLMCGKSVPAKHEEAHRQSMECLRARKYPPAKLDTWKCHCGAAGRYIDLEKPFTDCPRCGGEVQDS